MKPPPFNSIFHSNGVTGQRAIENSQLRQLVRDSGHPALSLLTEKACGISAHCLHWSFHLQEKRGFYEQVDSCAQDDRFFG